MAERNNSSATFSDENLLWLALAARNSGERPSRLLGIRGEVCALDFDLACTLRLLRFDNERELARFKTLAAMFGAAEDDDGAATAVADSDADCLEW